MNWRDYLTPEERQRIGAIQHDRAALQREYRKIWDRCRKRMKKENV